MKLLRFFRSFLKDFTDGDYIKVQANVGPYVVTLDLRKNVHTAKIYREEEYMSGKEEITPIWEREATTIKDLLKEARAAAKVFNV